MNEQQLIELWGEDLYNVFADHIDENGWLTSEWQNIIEAEIKRFDEDFNDNPLYKDTYGRMYNVDFEESEDGTLIRPKQ
ncbi:hypothetical protein [Flavobacterium cerinum]|uniref:Uncharacterized protein n=1 Tax=Flavobacterium cerinum TaxID=2502784 RepID=A0A444HES2_9FLAO|nr:hypothetical protein [Flavobacterium cerinum]RWX03390.1 hypothetical protein EPI11_00225 [Flavobacterium cerinum]